MKPEILGIGVSTFRRLSALKNCLECIARFTSTPYHLYISEDGGGDNTYDWCKSNHMNIMTGRNLGCSHNQNRLLYKLNSIGCTHIILLEDDAWPIQYAWERAWMNCANDFHHVNFAYDMPPPVLGKGTASDPFRCMGFGSAVNCTTADALNKVGYMHPAFSGVVHNTAHAEWTFRYERFFNMPRYCAGVSTPPCLDHGVRIFNFGTNQQSNLLQKSFDIQESLGKIDHFVEPWLNEVDREIFLSEQNC